MFIVVSCIIYCLHSLGVRLYIQFPTRTMLSNRMTSAKVISISSFDYISSRVSEVGLAAFFYKTAFGQKRCGFSYSFAQPCLIVGFK